MQKQKYKRLKNQERESISRGLPQGIEDTAVVRRHNQQQNYDEREGDFFMSLEIHETSERDLHNIKALWADGDVMKFVGFPNGLQKSAEEMAYWYQWIVKNRPRLNHYSIYLDDEYCGETFYKIDTSRDLAASMDIKLFAKARGKGVATRALSYAIEQAFLNGASKVWVDPDPCNHKALALYERLGFAKCEIPAHLKKEAYKQVYMEKEENKLSES